MSVGEIRVAFHYLRSGFTYDDQTHDDGLLCPLVVEEFVFRQAGDEIACIDRRVLNVFQIIGQAIIRHIGFASATT